MHPIIQQDIEDILRSIEPSIQTLENKNILITGASGMLASYIVYTVLYANEHIFKKPAQLYLVVRKRNEYYGKNKHIHYLHLDIAKTSPVKKHYHFIIHSASKAAPKLYMNNMIDTMNTNILGLYNLLKCCDKYLESMLYVSSAEIYGTPETNKPIDEKYIGKIDHLNERSCYVEGKRAGEMICINYYREQNLPIKIARLFHTFGPGLNLEDGRIFSDFINMGLKKENIIIRGDKTIKRPMLYLKDATIMLIKLLLSSENGQVYNISNDKNVITVGKFARTICDSFNKIYPKKLKVVIENQKAINYYKHAVKAICPNINKFKRKFSYKPDTNVEQALQKTIQYYLSPKEKHG